MCLFIFHILFQLPVVFQVETKMKNAKDKVEKIYEYLSFIETKDIKIFSFENIINKRKKQKQTLGI